MLAHWNNRKPAAGNLAVDPTTRFGRNLVGAWLLNEGAGALTQDAVSGSTGILLSAPTSVAGRFNGRALQFGSNSHVLCGTNLPRLSRNRTGTVIAHIYSTSFATSQTIFCCASTQSPSFFVTFGIVQTSGKLFVQTFWADGFYNHLTQCNTTALSLNTWYQVAVSCNGSAWTFYIDGVLQSTSQVVGSNTGDWWNFPLEEKVFRIGLIDSNSLEPFNGIIDHVLVWDRAFTQAEVQLFGSYPFLPIGVGEPSLISDILKGVGDGVADPPATHTYMRY